MVANGHHENHKMQYRGLIVGQKDEKVFFRYYEHCKSTENAH